MAVAKRLVLSGAVAALLSGCGGSGGEGPATAPAPPTAPTPTPTPAPTNTNIADLRASQSFANDAVTTDVSFNLASRTTISARAGSTALSVSYDAASNSYTITGGGTADVFGPADKQSGTNPGETRYSRRDGAITSTLTLVTTPFSRSTSNRYVGLGYLQRNASANERQDTVFRTFTYGLDTPPGGVPRTGSGTFSTDAFGLESFPGAEPVVFQGAGQFDVDFVNGLFSTSTMFTRRGLISGQGVVGGGLELKGGGRLSAANGTFSGEVVYSGGARPISGQLAGRFYGPNADEIGASFSGAASDGSAFSGSLTGQRDASLKAANISFARLVAPQLFFADSTELTVRLPKSGGAVDVRDYPGALGTAVSRSQFTDKTSGNVSYFPPTSGSPGGDYTVTSIVSGDPNFTTYTREIAGQQTRLELYKTGPDNKELALTYASFGRYTTSRNDDPFFSESNRVFFVYGFNAPSGLFSNRTGTASYAGVAYGAGANAAGTIFDVTGTSRLQVDFGAQSYTGSLALKGVNGATTVDYGAFSLAGKLFSYGSAAVGDVSRGGGPAIGSTLINFYGPSADEAGGLFRLRVPDGAGAGTLVTGAMVAKKQ